MRIFAILQILEAVLELVRELVKMRQSFFSWRRQASVRGAVDKAVSEQNTGDLETLFKKDVSHVNQ